MFKLNSFLRLVPVLNDKFIILIRLCFIIISCLLSVNYNLYTRFTPSYYISEPLHKRCEVLILKGLSLFVLLNQLTNQNKIRLNSR